MWLSEGGISEDAVQLLDELGIRWTASGEGVWRNSCRLSGYDGDDEHSKRSLFMPYQQPDSKVRLFFRDDGLYDIEASLTDVKDHDYPLSSGLRKPGEAESPKPG